MYGYLILKSAKNRNHDIRRFRANEIACERERKRREGVQTETRRKRTRQRRNKPRCSLPDKRLKARHKARPRHIDLK